MLTGEKPYTGEHLTTVVYKIVAEEPVPPHRLNPSLSAGIENVLRKALSKKPDARYRNCQEFSEALEKACGATQRLEAAAARRPAECDDHGRRESAADGGDRGGPGAAAAASQEQGRNLGNHHAGGQEEVGIPGVPAGDSGSDGFVDSDWLAVGLVAFAGLPAAGQRRDGSEEGRSDSGYPGGHAAADTAGSGAGGRQAKPGESAGA